MGMSASQVRLLSLTARLHDVELEAQSIMAQKLALATQKDDAYEEYNNALEATTIKVAYGVNGGATTTYVDANYNSVCTYQKDRMKQYALKDNRSGLMIVTEDVKEAYEQYGNDKYTFAYAMMGFAGKFGWPDGKSTIDEPASRVGIGTVTDEEAVMNSKLNYIPESDGKYSLYMTECEQMVYDVKCESDNDLKAKYDAIGNAENTADKITALDEFRALLYKKYSSEIYENMNLNKQEIKEYTEPYDDSEWSDISEEFTYYAQLWNAIHDAGGCTTIDSMYTSGDAGNEWFNNMVNAGMATIMVWDENNSKNKTWSETSVATSINNNYLQEVQDDTDLKKAEAKYEHTLNIINRKDTKFDTELSKLETERTSITTEMESIEKVRDDNIDRTFGIFS